MSHARRRARQALVQALYQWQMTGQDADEIDAQFSEEHQGSKTDIPYFRELIHQIIRQVMVLDEMIAPYIDRDISTLDPVERAILRLGCYEVSQRLDLPYRIVINESIDLAKRFGADQSYRYINGVMDKLARKYRQAEVLNEQDRL